MATSQGFRAPVATVWEVAADTELLMGMHEGVSSGVDLSHVVAAAPLELRRAVGADRFPRLLPPGARPDVCVVIGGSGATSALHGTRGLVGQLLLTARTRIEYNLHVIMLSRSRSL